MANLVCKCCSLSKGELFYRVDRTPVNSCLLISSYEEAVNFKNGALHLAFCPDCGFIWNVAFSPDLIEYSERYEETQGYSNTFNAFHLHLALDLIKRYDLINKRILEIGCGKGEFLEILCQEGNNMGVGFDPAYVEGRLSNKSLSKLKFIQDFYSEKYSHMEADFVCCKMTLEHIPEPAMFLQTVRKTIGPSPETVVFFMVPDAEKLLEEGAMEDFYYEHCSYFSRASLRYLFQRCGFAVQSIESVYAHQYLVIEARPSENICAPEPFEPDLAALESAVKQFRKRCEENRKIWKNRLDNWARQARKVVLWGAGSKAVGFLSAVGNAGDIEYIVDINPNKSGTFAAGTGQQIVQPEVLVDYVPDDIVIMNSIYREEISAQVASLSLNPRIHSLHIPG